MRVGLEVLPHPACLGLFERPRASGAESRLFSVPAPLGLQQIVMSGQEAAGVGVILGGEGCTEDRRGKCDGAGSVWRKPHPFGDVQRAFWFERQLFGALAS